MPLKSFDHVVIPTADPEAMLAFYKRLGFTCDPRGRVARRQVTSCSRWRLAITRSTCIRRRSGRAARFTLRGPTAVPGCGDFCFVWDGTIEEAAAWLKDAGAEVIEGPVKRDGGRAWAPASAPACTRATRTVTCWSSWSTIRGRTLRVDEPIASGLNVRMLRCLRNCLTRS